MVLVRPLLSVSVDAVSRTRLESYSGARGPKPSTAMNGNVSGGSHGNCLAVAAILVLCHLCSFGVDFPVPHSSVSLYWAGKGRIMNPCFHPGVVTSRPWPKVLRT